MTVESVLKAWVFFVYHFLKSKVWVARQKDRMPHASQYLNPGRDRVPWTEGLGNGEEERSSHAACWKREAGYSFGWTNGGAEDTLGFHGGHTLLQPLYGQGGTGAGTGGEVYAMDLRRLLREGGTACPD